jgi:L-ribulose-5-phosphate 4-epimerase
MISEIMQNNLKPSKFNTLKKRCLFSNKELIKKNLSIQTFGNTSDRLDSKYFTIKPSGINLNLVKSKEFNIIEISTGKVVEGKLNPSSDTETHRLLYKNYVEIRGIAHGHPNYSTSWAQTGKPIPVLGTTHADYFKGNIPITKKLKKNFIKNKYEYNTGVEIVSTLKKNKLEPRKCPGILVTHHGVFAWVKSSLEAVNHLELIEYIAMLAFNSIKIGINDKIDSNLINKHFDRKHGKNFYYGQKK